MTLSPRIKRSASTGLYDYESLQNLPCGTVRLLQLWSGSHDDDLRGLLFTEQFSRNPEYYALSYTWGDTNPDKFIQLDGRHLPIRDNLYKFLKHMRQPAEDIYLWVDAICINQEDLAERNSQVKLMSRVYSAARGVFAWLGESPLHYDGTRCLELLRPSEIDSKSLLDRPGRPALNDPSMKLLWPRAFLTTNWNLIRWIWQTIAEIAERPYWTRAWVIQEVAFSKDLTLCFDSAYRIPWEVFAGWCDTMRLCNDRVFTEATGEVKDILAACKERLAPCHEILQQMDNDMRIYRKDALGRRRRLRVPGLLLTGFSRPGQAMEWSKPSPEHTLRGLVKSYMHTQCLDPRDKVFAFIGLAVRERLRTNTRLEADYTLSLTELFWEMIRPDISDSLFAVDLIISFKLTAEDLRNSATFSEDDQGLPMNASTSLYISCILFERSYTWSSIHITRTQFVLLQDKYNHVSAHVSLVFSPEGARCGDRVWTLRANEAAVVYREDKKRPWGRIGRSYNLEAIAAASLPLLTSRNIARCRARYWMMLKSSLVASGSPCLDFLKREFMDVIQRREMINELRAKLRKKFENNLHCSEIMTKTDPALRCECPECRKRRAEGFGTIKEETSTKEDHSPFCECSDCSTTRAADFELYTKDLFCSETSRGHPGHAPLPFRRKHSPVRQTLGGCYGLPR